MTLAPPKIFKETAEAKVKTLDILLNGTAGTFKSVIGYNGNFYDESLNKLPMTEVTIENLEQYGFDIGDLSNFNSEVTVYTLIDRETMNSYETVTVELSYDLTIERTITYQISFDKETWYGYDGTTLVERYEMTKAEFEAMNITISDDEIYYKTIIRSDDEQYPVLEEINTTFEPQSHLEGSLDIPYSNDLPGTMDIPVTFTEVIEPNKDTYVDQNKPTSNYGDYDNLKISPEHKILIGFDFNLSDNAVIQSAKLVLKDVGDNELEVDVRRLLSDWGELDTTWLNTPDASFDSYGRLDGEEVDLTDLVKSWNDGELDNFGILLEAIGNEDKRYYSSEYHRYEGRPKLIIKYYDPEVLAYADKNDLTATAEVPHHNDLQASIEIDPIFGPDLDASIEVKYRGNDNLDAIVDIRESDTDDLTGLATISKPDLPITGFVAERNDLSCTMEVMEFDESDLDSKVSISKPDLPSFMELTIHDNLNSLITIRETASDDLTINGAISKPNLQATAEVPYREDLLSAVTARQSDESDLNATITVSKPEMPATIWPRIHDDLTINATVRQSDESDLYIIGAISKPDLISEVIVPYHNDLPATMTVRQNVDDDLDGNIAVTRPDMPSTIELVIASSIPGTMTINRYDNSDLEGTIGIAAYGTSDLRARIIPRPRDVSEIYSTMEVVYADTLEAKLEITEHDSIFGTIEVYSDTKYADADMDSKIHVRLKLPRHWNQGNPKLPRLWYQNANRWVNDEE
jgi:hypothetical protein